MIEKNELIDFIIKKIKVLTNKQKNLEKNLNECEKWKSIHHTADLLHSNMHKIKRGMQSIKVLDWTLNEEIIVPIHSQKKISDYIAALYKKSRKLKKGIPFLQNLIQNTIDEEKKLKSYLNQIENNEDPTLFINIYEKLNLKKNKTTINKPLNLPYKEFISNSGFKIWVGKSSSKNEILTFHFAKGSDYWLHARDFPGSHVIIKTDGKQVDQETLYEAGKLALKHSKGKNFNEGEVIYTLQKFVKKIKATKKGAVNVSHTKSLLVKLS